MGKNIIYYGPPGTGKTFLMQNITKQYFGFDIDDQTIRDAYINSSQEWVVLALILLQNDNLLTSNEISEIIQRIRVVGFNELPSTVLENHSVSINTELFTPRQPQIFEETNGKWSVSMNRLMQYEKDFLYRYLSEEAIDKRYEFVTFHQSFVYEDFVEGIRPNVSDNIGGDGGIGYSVQDGVFKRICKRAMENPQKNYAIFIDEINRGNISEIFGELITLIEQDKRLGEVNELKVLLPYSKTEFGVPNNLDIIGTLNSADRSIALIDFALRRRFEFVKMNYDINELEKIIKQFGKDPENIDGINVLSLLEVLNKRIELLLDDNYVIGHAFFTKVSSYDDIKNVILNKVVPLLEEYFYDDPQKIQMIFADLTEEGELKDNAVYKHEYLEAENLFGFFGEYNLETKKRYFKNLNIEISSIQKIYES
ncbi:AAA family ATPase [Paenibacillus barengoltzii]|uniref:McrB family protein n=1 Tax=Paenibacillus barengoltzii TaxID=343517 RepID=UPI002DBE5D44|nr:AAA family ATPase [Paenibacillus barengoltzii]MEC2345018.1 AAA family ATPase [Paenibacillus barengoltzii]